MVWLKSISGDRFSVSVGMFYVPGLSSWLSESVVCFYQFEESSPVLDVKEKKPAPRLKTKPSRYAKTFDFVGNSQLIHDTLALTVHL